MLELFDENWFKTFETLKDELGLMNLNFLSYDRLIKPLLKFKARNLGTEAEVNSNGVQSPVDKHRRTLVLLRLSRESRKEPVTGCPKKSVIGKAGLTKAFSA